jgi:hypothetical protein
MEITALILILAAVFFSFIIMTETHQHPTPQNKINKQTYFITPIHQQNEQMYIYKEPSSPEYITRKHTVESYRSQQRKALKRRKSKK